MKRYLPFLIGGVGLSLIFISMILRNGMENTHEVVTNLSSSFMVFAGCICVIGGIVTWFLRGDEHDVW